ncbi:MAG: hypothetical protein ABR540_01500 [Acidimicrobiales bacterium]
MSVTEGREMFDARRPTNAERGTEEHTPRPVEGVRRSVVATGRAMFAATRREDRRALKRAFSTYPTPTTGGSLVVINASTAGEHNAHCRESTSFCGMIFIRL